MVVIQDVISVFDSLGIKPFDLLRGDIFYRWVLHRSESWYLTTTKLLMEFRLSIPDETGTR